MPALHDNQLPAAGAARSDLLETKLFALLGMVNDWLKFAETKNGVVLTASGGALALLLNRVDGASSISTMTWVLGGTGGSCLLLSLLSGLLSFFPRTTAPRLPKRSAGAAADVDNLYYFGHLARYDAPLLAREINRRYLNAPDDAIGEAALALATQVVINARITLWKLNLFSFAVALFGAGFTLSMFGVAILALA